MNRAVVVRAALFCTLLAGGIATTLLLPIRAYLARFLEWIQDLGPAGLVLLGAFYIPASIFLLPASLVTLGAGFAFGLGWGLVAVSIGSTLGAAAAFLVGRFLARQWVEGLVAQRPRFRALDQAIAEQGFKIVFLTRLSPVFPFNFLNYAFGLTRVRFRDYFFASWIGMFPGTVMYVYLGSAVKDLADLVAGRVEGGTGQKVLFFGGLLATIVVTVYVTRVARQALDRAVGNQDKGLHGAESDAPRPGPGG